MKNMGVAGPDSSKETAKSSDLPITYLLPSFSSTKSLRGEYDSVLLNTFLLSLTDKLNNLEEWEPSVEQCIIQTAAYRKRIKSSHDSVVSGSFQPHWINSFSILKHNDFLTVVLTLSKSEWFHT